MMSRLNLKILILIIFLNHILNQKIPVGLRETKINRRKCCMSNLLKKVKEMYKVKKSLFHYKVDLNQLKEKCKKDQNHQWI